MHICFLCNEYPPAPHGGVGTFTQTLGRALVRRGHQVTVVGIGAGRQVSNGSSYDDHGVRVIGINGGRIPRIRAISSHVSLRSVLRRIHTESQIDVLEGPELCLSLLPRRFLGTKVIRMHGGHHFFCAELGHQRKPLRSWLERRSFRNADHLAAVSQHVAGVTSKLLGLRDQVIEILPNPVDTLRFAPQTSVTEVPFRILFVGTVCEKKGVRQLLLAMPSILERESRAHLQIAGRDWCDPFTGESYTEKMQQLASQIAPGRVEFLGATKNSDLPQLLSAASVCVMPSHSEAMPLAWLEALAAGRPLVVSKSGPGPEVVEDRVSGLLCDPHDPESIASCVSTLLSAPDMRQRLSQAARRRAVELFSVEAIVTQNEKFYSRCVGQRRVHIN